MIVANIAIISSNFLHDAIILVAYQLDKVLSTNKKDEKGIPIVSFEGMTWVNIVNKPVRAKTG